MMELRRRDARTRPGLRAAVVVLLLAGVVGCAATRSRRGTAPRSGFLGDYSMLGTVEGYEAREIFVADDVDWSRYRAIHIDSVTLWATGKSAGKLRYEEQQMLTDLVYAALYEKLSERFLMADQSGPQTIELRAALTEARGANVPLNVATTIVPQLRAVTTIGGFALDTAQIVGSATVEIEARDSISYQRLAAAVDSRAGNKSIQRAFSKWADVKAAADFWAERVRDFFVRQGVTQRS